MRTFLHTSGRILGPAALSFIMGLPAMATPINGMFDGSGTATVSLTNFDLCPNGDSPIGANSSSACTAASGNIALSSGTGSFSSITSSFGDLSTILSLNDGTEPIGTTVSVPNWLVFNPTVGAPPIMITLTEVTPGTASDGTADCTLAPAAGQNCTPTGSGFTLENETATTSSATTTFYITATDSSGDVSTGTATFSASFSVPYQTLLEALESGGGTGNYSSTYSAAFTLSAVPEPATLSLSGFALLGIGFLGRRKRK
jgi:hypothetical protein